MGGNWRAYDCRDGKEEVDYAEAEGGGEGGLIAEAGLGEDG